MVRVRRIAHVESSLVEWTSYPTGQAKAKGREKIFICGSKNQLVAGGGATAKPLDEAGIGEGPEGILDGPSGQLGAVHDFGCLDPFFGSVLEGLEHSHGAFGKLGVARISTAVKCDVCEGFPHDFKKKPAK